MKTALILSLAAVAAWLAFAQAPAGRAPLPEGVKAHLDLAYVAGGHSRQKLDLYLPEKAEGPLPLIIWVHGGGWQSGSKDNCPPLRQDFVKRGYAVASLDYRFSGDAVFPAQIEDCKAAVRWLRAHAKEYGLDPERFGACGNSAGGHLVALLGTSGDEKAFDVGANLEQPSRVQAVCDYYGPTDLAQMDAQALPGARYNHDSPKSPESCLIGGPLQENKEKAARASPLTYVQANRMPPFLIVHGDADLVVSFRQSELLFAALKQAGGSVRLHCVKNAGHGEGFGGSEIDEMVCSFFDRWLKAPGALRTESPARSPRGEAKEQRAEHGNGRMTFEKICTREDTDGDGRVTSKEFKGPTRLFERLDRSRDGVLTKEDFEAAR